MLMCYKDEIDRQATVRNVSRTEHSNWKLMKICASISHELIEALPSFHLKKWKERKKEIGTKNHKKVDGKLLRTDKQFRHLKQRQKETVSTWLYEEYRRPLD